MNKFGVIGLGRFGSHVVKTLFEQGHELIAIDEDADRVQEIAPFATQAVVLDATDAESLYDLGMSDCEACIVATGDKISTSILICSALHELGVKKVIVKALDDEHGKVLKKVGASQIIHPERDSAVRLANTLSRPNLVDFLPISGGLELRQIEAPPHLVGQDLRSLNLRAQRGVHLVAVKEELSQEVIPIPPADYVIKARSMLVLIGSRESLDAVVQEF